MVEFCFTAVALTFQEWIYCLCVSVTKHLVSISQGHCCSRMCCS